MATKAKSKAKTSVRKKSKRVVHHGVAHVYASFNNTLITITDQQGNVLVQSSAGAQGFKGSRKNTPHAATTAGKDVGVKAINLHDMREIDVIVRGQGSGREGALRGLNDSGLKIRSIEDRTPVPHNGTRRKKARRV